MPKLDGGTILVELDYEILEDNGEYMVELCHDAMDGSIYLNRKTAEGAANLLDQLRHEDETPVINLGYSKPSTSPYRVDRERDAYEDPAPRPAQSPQQSSRAPDKVNLENIFEGIAGFATAISDATDILKQFREKKK